MNFLKVLGAMAGIHLLGVLCFAENPIVQTIFTADPAPMVHDDTFYVYCGHDETDVNSVWFNMKEWRLYSSVDMANWTDRGSPMNLSAFTWANADAWAGQVISRNNKFYFYAPVFHTSTKNRMIGVAVADKPTGPFTDAKGSPMFSRYDCCYIDPSAYVDDDGQAYLYWGNPYCYWVKLNADMISYTGDTTRVPENMATFGNAYVEAPWIYKRNNLYYLIFAADNPNGKENIRYSTSSSPMGPWAYKGVIMNTEGVNWVKPCTSWTNHEGIVDFKGSSYFVYHNAGLPNSGTKGFTRSVCIEKFTYNADGTIPLMHMTLEGPPQVGRLNPYDTTQAETICWEVGVKTTKCGEGGMNVDSINNGDYIKVKGVDFGTGAKSFDARVACGATGGNIELHLDSLNGTIAGTCAVTSTTGWQVWTTKSCTITGATGVHDLFLKFTGGSGRLFNFNWWKFVPVSTGTSGAEKLEFGSADAGIAIAASGKTVRLEFPAPVLSQKVTVRLFDINGRLKRTLFTGRLSSKSLLLPLDRTGLRPGASLVVVSLDDRVVVRNSLIISK